MNDKPKLTDVTKDELDEFFSDIIPIIEGEDDFDRMFKDVVPVKSKPTDIEKARMKTTGYTSAGCTILKKF